MKQTLLKSVHLVGLAIVIAVMAALATVNYFSWTAGVNGINQGQRDRIVAERISNLLLALAEADSAERGYLLTGQQTSLGSYFAAVSQVRASLAELSNPAFDTADGILAAQLPPLVSVRLTELDTTIQAQRNGDSNRALDLLRGDQGRQTTNAIRELCAKILAAHQGRFVARSAYVRERNTRMRIGLIWGTAGTVFILVLFGFSVHRLILGNERTIRDLDTARNESERATEALDTTLRSIGDAVVATDTQGRITFMNPIAEQLTAWPADDGCGRAMDEVVQLVDESTHTAVESPVMKVLRDGAIVALANHTALISRSGLKRPIDDSAAPIRDKTGALTGAVLVFRDVTERYQARKQLEDSELRYRLMFEINPQPVWVYDVNTLQFLAVNSAAVQLYGYSREEFHKMTVRDIRPAEDVPAMLDAVRWAAKLSRSGPRRHIRKDGTIILVEVTAQPLEFAGHNARIVLITDVTEKLAAEESLLEAHDLLKAFVDTAPVAVLTIDLVGRVTSWNATATELFQWTRDEIMGKLLPIIPEEQRADFQTLLAGYRTGYRVSGLETVRVRKDGFRIPVDIWSAPLTDKQGKCTGVLGIVADVSKRKRGEQALVETEAGFRLLFESNPQPMWVFHRETLQFLELNRAAIARYGYSREEFLGMSVVNVVRDQDIPQLLDSIGEVEALQKAATGEHRLKNGRVIEVEAVVHSLEFKGAPAMLAVLKDITEWKKIENQLRESQKLEAVGRLAGGVAHDFNNLLTVISGYTELLHQSGAAGADRSGIDEIAKAADRAASLTRQLLAFSRGQILQPRSLVLNDNVRKMNTMLSRLLGEDIDLKTDLASDLWQVLADPTQVDQIIMNLSVNARDAMERGGTLTIQTSNVTIDDAHFAAYVGLETGEFVTLSVSDTGHGMDEETKAHIFEPFFTTKEPGRGTGLGLATVYGIVKQTGGRVVVYSEPGQGTRIIIYLPRAAGESRELLESRVAAPQTGTETVLLVEDDDSVAKLVTVMLQGSGYTVIAAKSGEEALKVCGDYSVHLDLMITDLVLPHMDGQEIARTARECRPGLQILFMSGYTEHAALRPGRFEAGEHFIQKPFSQGALTRKVREILGEGLKRTTRAGA